MAHLDEHGGQQLWEEVLVALDQEPSPQEVLPLKRAEAISRLVDMVEMDPAKIQDPTVLKAALCFAREELARSDAMLPLLLDAERLKKGGRWVAFAYKLIEPSLKILNDALLGPQLTNVFVGGMHEVLKDIGQNGSKVPLWLIHEYFKGGTFLLDLDEVSKSYDFQEFIKKYPEKTEEEFVKKELLKFEEMMHVLLGAHVKEQLDKPNLPEDKRKTLSEWTPKSELRLSFGMASLPSTGLDLDQVNVAYKLRRAFNQAQKAANIKAARVMEMPKDARHNRESASFFKLEDLLTDLLRTRCNLDALVDQPGFQDCFVEKEGRWSMEPKALYVFRKGGRVEGVSDEVWAAFVAYYDAVNYVDLLKPFQVAHFPAYHERLLRIKTLIEKMDVSLKDEDASVSTKHGLLKEAFDELSVCQKDEGEKNSQTEYALIAALRRPGPHQLAFFDHCGFGVDNMGFHEDLTVKLLGLLGKEEELRFKLMNSSERHSALAVWVQANQDKVEEMYELLFAAGDPGSALLRGKDTLIQTALGSDAVINAEGGDEVVVDVPGQQSVNSTIEGVRARIALLQMDKPMLSPGGQLDELRVYVLAALWAERVHSLIKKMNDPSKQLLSAQLRR